MGERKQFKLGLIGFGEVGSTLGKGFHDEGLVEIVSYDKFAFDGPFADLIQGRAGEAGVPLVASPQELAARCDMIVGVTPGKASVESAEAFAPHLKPRHTFVDFASATPKVKRAVGAALQTTGAQIADASIMGTPHADGHRLPILASGPAAVAFRDLLSPWGLKIEHVPGELGAASGIKIMRSVIAKGLEALLVECMLGSRRYGIDEEVMNLVRQVHGQPAVRGDGELPARHRCHPLRAARAGSPHVGRCLAGNRHRADHDASHRGAAGVGVGARRQESFRRRRAQALPRGNRRPRSTAGESDRQPEAEGQLTFTSFCRQRSSRGGSGGGLNCGQNVLETSPT